VESAKKKKNPNLVVQRILAYNNDFVLTALDDLSLHQLARLLLQEILHLAFGSSLKEIHNPAQDAAAMEIHVHT
jgi:hypothetical protein